MNENYYVDDTGHVILNGSRWHHPKTGDPTKCAVEGCPREMGVITDRSVAEIERQA